MDRANHCQLKTMQTKTIVKPHEGDHMPYQVATNLLTEPKAKLSNRMRKNCRAAREVVLRSAHVILRDELKNPFEGASAKPMEVRILNRMKKSTTPQLVKWQKR